MFEVVRRYPAVSPFLSNPKVELVIDDGRRWMLRNHDRKFDMIVMDTIYHWRAHATNLLSVEFLELARGMLKPGGILYYNTTFSPEAQRTGAMLFPVRLPVRHLHGGERQPHPGRQGALAAEPR